MIWVGLAGFAVVLFTAGLMLGLSFLRRKSAPAFRDLPAFARLRQAVGRVVEDGTRLHVSLGRGGLTTPQGAAALAGLGMLRRLADLTSASDQPPVATSGDSAIAILSQDTLQSSFQTITPGAAFDITAGRLAGLTPFSYAAGTLPVMHDENVSATLLMGNFGVEAALLTDAAERTNTYLLAASDNLPAQAVLYASAPDALIGEELFAAQAYNGGGPLHSASLTVQDILRWLLIAVLLAGAALKLAGFL
ncbi:MAG: hypothetical protein FD146_191 [Anaerolineaceae bacterium]|nr:MAG: hypothetical protein FD146_191 [Anaerolineaceae bacterium]